MHDYQTSYTDGMQEKGSSTGGDKNLLEIESDSGSPDIEKAVPASTWIEMVETPIFRMHEISWRTLLAKVALFFLPSFIQGRYHREWTRSAKLHPTAYLDGMRGLGALAVFFCHYSYQCFLIAESYGCADRNWAWLKLPIIRLFYQGPAAVCIFFVVSGYALSYKPLKLIHNKTTDKFSETLSSLIFRRGIRLFLPAIISTFMVICFIRIGAYEWTRDFANDEKYMKNIVESHPRRLDTMSEQLIDWIWSLYSFIHVFSWNPDRGRIKYDVHLWTIPVEYMCSLYVFLVLMATARLSPRCRLATVTSVAFFTYRSSRWELLLFLSGMFIAEFDILSDSHNTDQQRSPLGSANCSRCPKSFCATITWTALGITGLYLLSQPDANGHITPGWVYLCSLVPKWWTVEGFRYWQSAGAVLFVFAVGRSSVWQQLFNSRVVQYFGRLSFAIYLMHGPVMHAVGYHFEKMAYRITGVDGYWFNAGFLLHACFCVPTVVWWADIFWRAVDLPTVRFAKWLEEICLERR